MEYTELKIVTEYNDEKKFENEVNGWCSNCGYKIISCQAITVDNINIMYTAFLGK